MASPRCARRAVGAPTDGGVLTASAMARMASASPGLERGKAGSITSTPPAFQLAGDADFSLVIAAPGLCSPSRKVVSKNDEAVVMMRFSRRRRRWLWPVKCRWRKSGRRAASWAICSVAPAGCRVRAIKSPPGKPALAESLGECVSQGGQASEIGNQAVNVQLPAWRFPCRTVSGIANHWTRSQIISVDFRPENAPSGGFSLIFLGHYV